MLSWLLVAVALIALPGSPRAPDSLPQRSQRRSAHPRVLPSFAAAGAAVLAVGLCGPVVGGTVAAVAAPLAWFGAIRLRDRSHRARDPAAPLALDLAAAALRAGRTVPDALALAAPAAHPHTAELLARVGRLLELGADPVEAWQPLAGDAWLATIAAAGRRSATSGARLAAALEQAAADLRASARAAALARAHRAGALAVAPLGLCFLPAFVCLGIVPVVVGLARGLPGGLP